MPDIFLEIDTIFEGKAKEILPKINWAITQRKTEYTQQLVLLQTHSSVSIRRKVALGLSQLGTKEDIDKLKDWQTREGDRETWLNLQSSIDKLDRSLDGIEKSVVTFSVTEALKYLKNLLGSRELVIEGELSEVRPMYQMYYFGIKDSLDSRIDCGCFAGVVARLGFPMNEGLSVRISGTFKLGKNSRLYFDVKSLVLTGEGELLRNLKLLEDKLVNEGLFDPSRKRSIPVLPNRIMLLASGVSAAVDDFYKVLGERRGGIEMYHLAIKTQGQNAEFELLEKLEFASKKALELNIDTIVITRGGGSSDDLALFNNEKVVRAIHGLSKPTIVAIGHQRDTTFSELVADLRASTPSNAAQLVSLSRDEVLASLQLVFGKIQGLTTEKQVQYLQVSTQLITRIERDIRIRIQEHRLICNQVFQLFTSHLRFVYHNIPSVEKMIFIVRQELQKSLFMAQKAVTTISLFDTDKIVNMGYSILMSGGEVVDSIEKLKIGQTLDVTVRDGKIKTEIKGF